MANDFIALPAPAANGAGAWTDCSAMGGLRTIVVTTPDAFVTIECSNQLVAANAYSVTAFQANGEITVQAAAHWMRAVVSNFAAGGVAPIVNVGSTGDGTTTVQLATTVVSGVAAATDTTALPAFKTIQVTGGFTGSLNIEISEDAGATYATAFSFSNGGSQSGLYVADRMRVRRVGVVPGGALPQVWVGATAPPGGSGGGGGGVIVDHAGTPVVSPATILNFIGATVADAGGGQANITVVAGAPYLTISRFVPADGGTVNCVAGAYNGVDVQHMLTAGFTLQLPAASSVPAGTPLEIGITNNGSAPLSYPFVGIGARPGAVAFATGSLSPDGSDTIGQAPFAGAFVKNGDCCRLISDGISDWCISSFSWVSISAAGLVLAAGANQVDVSASSGEVPNILQIGPLVDSTSVINAISAGYIGQRMLIVNADPAHTFALHAGFGGALTANCQALRGTVADYTLASGSSRMLEYWWDASDASIGCWYILGDA
jgi:hypothetical protein